MRQPKVGEIIYAISFGNNRVGETEFLCSTQENAAKSLAKIEKEVEELLDDMRGNWDPAPTKEELLEECGEIIIYEMKRIK